MHIGQEDVVGILQADMLLFQDVIVPVRCQDGADRLFADFAAQALAVFVQQFVEGFDFVHHYQVIQILAGMRKVLANIGADFHAQLG